MEESIDNRMAIPPRRRGPQPGQSPTPLPQPAEVVEVPQPALKGIRCPGCGRGMVPRRTATNGGKVYAACTLCGCGIVLTYSGKDPATVRLVQ
jgi:hypothetical protein